MLLQEKLHWTSSWLVELKNIRKDFSSDVILTIMKQYRNVSQFRKDIPEVCQTFSATTQRGLSTKHKQESTRDRSQAML
jgi:hypothetical protein